jgi:hypothetical protein
MKIQFKATAKRMEYAGKNYSFGDGEIHDLPPEHCDALLANYPANFVLVSNGIDNGAVASPAAPVVEFESKAVEPKSDKMLRPRKNK